MSAAGKVPARPKIYHLTHLGNVAGVIQVGALWSDAKRLDLGLECEVVGMSSIKERRMKLPVKCHPRTTVGQYAPFYFFPRSIMLYILHKGNHPDLTYRGGQGPIVHLVADLRATVAWTEAQGRRWAFSTCNAGARYADFYAELSELDKISWEAVNASDFRDPVTKDGKQAELLIHESFPWELIETIGVLNPATRGQVEAALHGAVHRPAVQIQPSWYY